MAGSGGVDDGETRVAEDYFATIELTTTHALIVRAAVLLCVIHANHSIAHTRRRRAKV
jgi:hypothetical protein